MKKKQNNYKDIMDIGNLISGNTMGTKAPKIKIRQVPNIQKMINLEKSFAPKKSNVKIQRLKKIKLSY